mmetsp:Transcript_1491/g.2951  ORF Transcript_1491/g.2951 Transcript_1491/m.2951 type:complete len:274 (+) Transcript_1491:207-1028(+)|eukprot:6178925-Pleurochrysis_carterae.AAC.1
MSKTGPRPTSLHSRPTAHPLLASDVDFYYFSLPGERTTAYFNHSVGRLHDLGYNVQLMDGAIAGKTKPPPGMVFDMKPHEIGNFLIHEGTWASRVSTDRPVVTIEADTFPLLRWSNLSIPRALLDSYDALFLHQHPNVNHKGCATANPRRPKVLEGYGNHTFGIGATLWTNRRPLSHKMYTDPRCATGPGNSIQLASDVWLDCAHKNQLLRVGQLCPYIFVQALQHCARQVVGGKSSWTSCAYPMALSLPGGMHPQRRPAVQLPKPSASNRII